MLNWECDGTLGGLGGGWARRNRHKQLGLQRKPRGVDGAAITYPLHPDAKYTTVYAKFTICYTKFSQVRSPSGVVYVAVFDTVCSQGLPFLMQ